MPVITKYSQKLDIIEAVWRGEISTPEVAETNAEHIRLHIENGACRFLNDMSAVHRLSISYIDVFYLPAKEYEKTNINRTGVRIAVIKPSSGEGGELLSFYETACTNRGWNVRIFAERQTAIQWLTRTQDAP